VLKSIGATRGAILLQFLFEAMAIVTFGGLLGSRSDGAVTAGIRTPLLLDPLFKDTPGGTGDIHLKISKFAVITSTVVLEIIGLIGGCCPLRRRRCWIRLDPRATNDGGTLYLYRIL
jgi:ABC-type antimicrobial peptide transport system permease subunit